MTSTATSLAMLGMTATFRVAGCQEDVWMCPEDDWQWQPSDFEPTGLLRCESVPELCGLPVVSVIREPDRDVAIDIVFVGDGYTTSNLGAFRSTVENWIREMDADTDGVVGRDRTLFNFHRVGLTPLASEADLTCTDENGDSSEVTLRLHD